MRPLLGEEQLVAQLVHREVEEREQEADQDVRGTPSTVSCVTRRCWSTRLIVTGSVAVAS